MDKKTEKALIELLKNMQSTITELKMRVFELQSFPTTDVKVIYREVKQCLSDLGHDWIDSEIMREARKISEDRIAEQTAYHKLREENQAIIERLKKIAKGDDEKKKPHFDFEDEFLKNPSLADDDEFMEVRKILNELRES